MNERAERQDRTKANEPNERGGTMGRPRIDLTDDQVAEVERMAGMGLTQEEIAHVLGFSERTLARRLKDDDRVKAAYARGMAQDHREHAERHRDIAFGKVGTPVSEQRKALEFRLERRFGWLRTEKRQYEGDLPSIRVYRDDDE